MNHIYRLCWNRELRQWVAASELAHCRRGVSSGRTVGRRAVRLSLLSVALGFGALAHAGTLPMGGQVVAGAGQITQSGNTTTIRQDSGVLSLNWQSFDVGADQTVNFLQPGASAIAVNRILGNTASEIYGHLNANGQVWLINPNGMLFGKSAQVNVGGLVASTLDLAGTPGSSSVTFSGEGRGTVVNQGSLNAAAGGYVALLGNQVSNQGAIRAQLGTVALGAGTAVTLSFADSHLMHLVVSANTVRSLAENRQLIVADGGQVLMSAGARDSLIASAVNNTGTVQARTVVDHNGTITLLGGMEAGTVQVGGTLDASAPNGGAGGTIETSAAHFSLAPDATITAASASGTGGSWLVDPVDLTIDSAAANTLSSTLQGGTNVTEQTTANSASGTGNQSSGNGDINVNAAINWTSSATLTLDAYHDINVDALVAGGGGIVMNATNGTLTVGNAGGLSAGAGATLAANAFVNQAGASALGSHWTLYTASPAGNTLNGLTADFIQYNATQGSTLAAGGNGLIYAVAPTLQITGLTGTVSKVYDNTQAADNFTGANFNTSGLLGGDTIASAHGGSYASVNVGSGLSVTAPGAIANFTLTNNGVPVYGYALGGSTVSGQIGTITPRVLTAQIVGDPTKVYDGTTTATLGAANYQIDGFVAGQGATVKQPSSIAYVGSDAGSQALNATFSVTNFTANNGTLLSNYTLPTTATGMGTITQAPLLISGLLSTNKVYDGGAGETLDTSDASLYGVIQPDAGKVGLDTSGITGTFAQSNVGNGIAISVSGYALTGDKASNYQLVAPTGLTANITPKTLTLDQVSAPNKVYDATTTASLDTSGATLAGLVAGDNVTLDASSASAQFAQADVGNHLAVSTSGFALAGAAAGNYVLTQPGLTASITPALLTISMTGTPEKTYDGTAAVALGSGNFNVTGFIGSQNAVVSQSSASYATSNAGNGIDVTATLQPSDFTPDAGTSLSNYTFAPTVFGAGLGTIDPLQLTGLVINNPTKVYDGTTDAALSASNLQLVGLLPGQSMTASFSGTVAGSYDAADAGARGVTANALSSAYFSAGNGTLLSNYLLPTSYVGSGTITPKALSGQVIGIGIVDASKVYDGTVNIQLGSANFTLSGFVGSDSATVDSNASITGQFGQADVGQDLALSATLSKSDLVAGSGTNLNNYALANPALGVGDITPRQLTVSVVGDPTKVYNGSVEASLSSSNFSINGWASGEGGSIHPTATASYDAADAGARTVTAVLTPGNYVLNSGTKLSNYMLDASATGAGTITRAPLYVTGVKATNKVYDTNTTNVLSTGNAGLAGLVDSDVGNVTLDLSGVSANFSQKNVGSHLAVTATGFAINGSEAANYTLQAVTGLYADITRATLTLAGVTADDKSYDGTRDAALTVSGSAALNGVLGSDSVSFDASGASGLFSTANAGNNLKVSASGFALTGSDAGNYQLTQPAGLTATINRKQLTAVITGSPTKVYDGSDSATLTAADYDLQGFVSGEGASIPQSATANYVTQNAGTGLGVVSTLVTSDFLANAGTNLSNYALPTSGAGNNGVIQPKVIDLTGSRVYDGTTVASSALFGTLQGVNGETLGLTGSGTLASKDVGAQWSFNSLDSLALADGNNGGLASNYTLAGGTDWVTITPRQLTASFDANDKTYDATATAVLANAALETASGSRGLVSGDDVTLQNVTSGHFANKNVGTGKTVTGDMSITGTDAGNYVFTNGSATADISALHINVTGTGKDKQYDATTNDQGATVHSTGVISGDSVSFSYSAATFDNKNVGNGKTVTVSGITSGGTDGANYVVDNTSVTTTADITPRVLNLSGSRIYDGTTSADANTFNGGVIGGVAGETLALSGSATLASKNAGSYHWSNGTGLSLGDGSNGGLASNYTLVGGTDSYTVASRQLTASFTATDKTYDGTTGDLLTNALLEVANGDRGLVSGDDVSLTNAAQGSFADKNVGTQKVVTGGMGITGTDAGNYVFTNGTALADIGKLALTIGATGVNKVYDGTTGDPGLAYTSNKIAGDNLTISSASVAFTDKNVGTGKTVNVGGIAIGGTDAGNYDLQNTTTTATADITPYVINLSGTRIYDAMTDADAGLFGNQDGTINGVTVGGVTERLNLTGSGQLASKNVNGGIPYTRGQGFNLGTLGLGDNSGLASNYTLVGGNDSLTLTKATLTVTGTTVADKVYNGLTNDAALNGSTLVGILSNGGGVADDVTLGSASTGTYASANVGTRGVTTHMTLAGADQDNYTIVQPTGLTGLITKAALTVTATDASKSYDGRSYTGGNGVAYAGFVNGETASVLGGSVVYGGTSQGSVNAGNYTLTASGLSSGNYAISYVDGALDVGKAALTVTATDASKSYDGQSYTGGNGVVYAGFVNGETASVLGGSVVYGGTAQGAVNAGNYTLTASGLSSGNYAISYVGGALDVGKAALTVTASDASKTYDGQSYTGGNGVIYAGFVNGETASVLGGSVVYGGTAQGAVNAGNYTLTASGLSSGNYAISYVDGALDVGKKVLSLSGTRVYDGTTDVAATDLATISGLVGSETLVLGGTAQVGDKNVGVDKGLTDRGSLTLSDGGNGGLVQNYTLVGGIDTLTITPKTITVDATASDKMYDAATTASVTSLTSGGILAGDTLSFGSVGATFADANAGQGKTVTVSGITASGTDAANYAINSTATTTADITPYVLDLSGTRVYDGSTGADASLFGSHGVLAGIAGQTVVLSGSGVLGDKNVGDHKPFAGLGTLALADGGNGGLVQNYTLVGGIDVLTVTPATLTVAGTRTSDRSYDGTRVDALSGAALVGVLGNDDVVLGDADTGLFADKNVGNGKTVTAAMTVAGGDVGNYVLVQPTGLVAAITPRSVTVTATGTDKMFDGNTRDVVGLNGSGVLDGETVGYSYQNAQFLDPNVGDGKTVNVSGIALTGADASNYVVAEPEVTTVANITGARPSAFGVSDGVLAYQDFAIKPTSIETPYGAAPADSVGSYVGNQKKRHRPIEANRSRADFVSGLSLQVVEGGVQLPVRAMP